VRPFQRPSHLLLLDKPPAHHLVDGRLHERRAAVDCATGHRGTVQRVSGWLGEGKRIETPTREQLAKLDHKRKKKGSNEEWQHPHDPDARITKDGRMHLAHKAEHAVDIETGAIIAVTVQAADEE
jgi:hypothetical protein